MTACEWNAGPHDARSLYNWPGGLGGAVGEFKTGLGPFGPHPLGKKALVRILNEPNYAMSINSSACYLRLRT